MPIMKLGQKLKENFAKNLQTLRDKKKLTQEGLARELSNNYKGCDIDLKRTSIVGYESSDGAMPKIDALYCIAQYFGKTIDQMISPSMDNPVLVHQWMIQGPATGPNLNHEPVRLSKSQRDESRVQMEDLNMDSIIRTCANGMAYRQFYVEFLKQLYQELLKSAGDAAGVERFETMFQRTFMGCLISKSKYTHDLAENLLNDQERAVFLAFQQTQATTEMVATALKLTEKDVINIFNAAQNKISSILEGK